MSGSPLDRIPVYNRVSIRAVLVHEGEDPGSALRAAGIVNPIAIPVVLGEDLDLSGGILGDGRTPNLTAVLETEAQDDFDASPVSPPDRVAPRPDVAQPADPVATTAPAAFGMSSLAPIRGLGNTPSARFGGGSADLPPSPGQSLETDAIIAAGWRKPPPYVRFDPLTYSRPGGATIAGNLNAASDDTTNQRVVAQPRDGQPAPEPTSQAGTVMPVADPTDAAGTRSLYASAGNDPINGLDSSGTTSEGNLDRASPSTDVKDLTGQPPGG